MKTKRQLRFKFVKFMITKEKGLLSGEEKFYIKWRLRFIPFMPWVNVKTKVFGVYKDLIYESHHDARKALELKIETNKILEDSYFNA